MPTQLRIVINITGRHNDAMAHLSMQDVTEWALRQALAFAHYHDYVDQIPLWDANGNRVGDLSFIDYEQAGD